MGNIWKYALRPTDRQEIMMPAGAKVLSAQVQDHQLNVWALVDPTAKPEPRVFYTVGTGHPVDTASLGRHIGTLQDFGGSLILHIFEGA